MKWARSKHVGRVSEVTLLTPVRSGLIPGERRTYEQRLSSTLASVQRRVDQGIPTPVGVLPTIHFARWLILRPRQYLQNSGVDFPGESSNADLSQHPDYRSWLFFTSNFDGDLKDYVREFVVFLDQDVDRIWGNCEGWPVGGSRDFEHFWDYVRRHQIPTHAFYAAYPDLTVGRIRQLQRFKRAFDKLVAGRRRGDGQLSNSVGDLLGMASGNTRAMDEIVRLLDSFTASNTLYSNDFPRQGGTYARDDD